MALSGNAIACHLMSFKSIATPTIPIELLPQWHVVCCQCNWQNLTLPDFLHFQAMCFATTVNAEFLIFSLRSFATSVIAGIWQCALFKLPGVKKTDLKINQLMYQNGVTQLLILGEA